MFRRCVKLVGSPGRFFASASDVVPPKGRPELLLNELESKNRLRVKRVGRGRSSGMGKTSTRGQKGTRARSGGSVPNYFEGGQTPLYRRLPKVGFSNARFRRDYTPVNLNRIQQWLADGKLKPDEQNVITMKALVDSGCVGKGVKDGIALLATGHKDWNVQDIQFQVSRASKRAIAAIERNNGSVVTVYHTRLTLRRMLRGEEPVKVPRPPPKQIDYYLSDENRGYLSQHVQLQLARERIERSE